MTVVEMLKSPEFWVSAVLANLVIGVVANLLSPHVGAIFAGNWLWRALAVNVLLIPILMAFGYSAVTTVWPIDVACGATYAAGYWMLAHMHGRALLAYAFWTPNLLAVVAASMLHGLGAEELLRPMLAVYPLLFIFNFLPVLIWGAVATIAQSPRTST